ncbi:hypothetical protein MHUMG1_08493 [Metarhizium humberi]|uniref:Uncharacterized protein n=1 Tax=Metarhizium humberi TaxID=2596975 RepID=A0A9P8M573_9HYPO|nr:hypothetical protein MHUMG1_08493 [Metarhizium humberi]
MGIDIDSVVRLEASQNGTARPLHADAASPLHPPSACHAVSRTARLHEHGCSGTPLAATEPRMYYEEKFQMVAQSRADFCTGQDDDMAGEPSLSQITALLRAATISQADADGAESC